MTIFTTALILFLIMNPLGQLKAFANSLQGINKQRQSEIITRELLIALGVMLFFNAVGEYIFDLLKISDVTVYLSLGIILFLGAINIIFPPADASGQKKLDGEPFLVPIAIPIIAGPALLATIMLYAQTEPGQYTTIIACAVAWFVASLLFLNHQRLFAFFGTSGILACEKLMGMILVLISVQRLLEGAMMFYQSVAAT